MARWSQHRDDKQLRGDTPAITIPGHVHAEYFCAFPPFDLRNILTGRQWVTRQQHPGFRCLQSAKRENVLLSTLDLDLSAHITVRC